MKFFDCKPVISDDMCSNLDLFNSQTGVTILAHSFFMSWICLYFVLFRRRNEDQNAYVAIPQNQR